MRNMQPLPAYGVESVDNALRLLLMLQRQPSVRVTEASQELGIARSTAHRLLATLANRGFVQQPRKSHVYCPGPALMEFVFSAAGIQGVRDAAEGPMKVLTRRISETSHLLMLEDGGARFIASLEPTRDLRVPERTGTILPAHATAAGKVLLSLLSRRDLSAYLSGGLQRLTSNTIINQVDLAEELEEVARQGYAINRGESLTDLVAIAVPVQLAGAEHAALAVSVPADRGEVSSLRRLLPELRRCSEEITARLRFGEPGAGSPGQPKIA